MKPETRSFYAIAVQKAVEQIATDLDRALDLQAIARTVALSPFHFHRVFRGMVGETPLELHRRLRMERAAWSLRQRDALVTAVAFAAGYETHESFTRAFRAYYECSPSEFRQSSQGDTRCARPYRIELTARSGIHFQAGALPAWIVPFVGGDRVMKVDIKQMQAKRVATAPHVGPYHRIADAFGRLGSIAGQAGLIREGAEMIAIYHDDPETTPVAELRSEAAITIGPDAKVPDGLGERCLPAGRYASTTHIGPYEKLGDAWARFMGEWLPESGERMRDGVSYEIYRNTPENSPQEKLETELYIPLD
jgi:AraC family transcriptional regulator